MRPATSTRSRSSSSCASRGAESLLARYRPEPGLDLAPAAELVHEVDRLVLAVRPRDPEPHRGPAPEAEAALLGDRARKHHSPSLDLVIDATSLAHAADVHLE